MFARWPIPVAFFATRVGPLTPAEQPTQSKERLERPTGLATTVEGHGFEPCRKQRRIQTRAGKAQLKRSLPRDPERSEATGGAAFE